MTERLEGGQAAQVFAAAARLAVAKSAEVQATARRLDAERDLIAATGFKKAEGQETYEVAGEVGGCRFVLKQPISASVDAEAWRKIRHKLPAGHPARGIFVEKYELRTREARALQESDPEAWKAVSGCVTRKPGKVSVDLEWVRDAQEPADRRSS